MAAIRDVQLTITRDVANADLQVVVDVDWNDFDRATNLEYLLTYRVFGDDTGFDGDLLGPDDPISVGLVPVVRLKANGQQSTRRTFTPPTIAWSTLNEDPQSWAGDDEIRAEATLTPTLPLQVKRESNLVTVDAS